jgi:phospholipase C
MRLSRRDFAKQALLASGSVALGCSTHAVSTGTVTTITGGIGSTGATLPSPASSGIEHIVVVTMENRSFDHLMGWLPNAAGKQAGLSYLDKSGVSHPTYALSGDFTGCPKNGPDHSYAGSRQEYNSGAMDGWLKTGANDTFAIGYYQEADIPFYAALARNYTTCDHYHSSFLGPTFPNRLFMYTGQTDRLDNSISISQLTTIIDRLQAAHVSFGYYYQNAPFTALWATQYLGLSHLHSDFFSAAAAGTLPAVSFVDPIYTLLDDGTGTDDHPHADIRKGDLFLHDMFTAIANGPAWSSTVVILNFDEGGGFFDHVAPPRVTAGNSVDTDLVSGKALLGFRLPVVIASPWTLGTSTSPRVNSLLFDHTSVLKFIEWRWGLNTLSPRDAGTDINNLAYALDFTKPVTARPSLPTPAAPTVGAPCAANPGGAFGLARTGPVSHASTAVEEDNEWLALRELAIRYGFKVS